MVIRPDPYEAAEAPLRAKKQQLEAELASIDSALKGIARAREMSGQFAPAPEQPTRSTLPVTAPESRTGSYHGQSIIEAVVSVLSAQPPKAALASRELHEILEREHFPIAHSNPPHAIHSALRKRAAQRGDVLLVGVGKWGLRKWYTDPEIDEIVENLGGMGGRDRKVHIERTKVGLETARSRGVVLGAKPKIDDAVKLRIQEMAARKGKQKMSLGDIAKENNIALSTIFYLFPGGRKTILGWKPQSAPKVGESQNDSVAGPLFDDSEQRHVTRVH